MSENHEQNEKEIDVGADSTPKDKDKPKEEPKQKLQPQKQAGSEITTAQDLTQKIISMSEEDFLPWEEVTLPSKGIYYGDKVPGGVVRVRPMSIAAEKIMTTQRLAQTGQSIDYLFENCVDLPSGFDQSELLTGDRVFLLYYLRGITHGNIYEFTMKCPHCNSNSSHVYDLNELANTIQYPKEELGTEPFKITLPYLSKVMSKTVWAKVRFMRGKDSSHIANRQRFNKRVRAGNVVQKRAQKEVEIDQSITDNLSLLIVSIGGEGLNGEEKDSIKIKAIVDKMHSKDTSTIREFMRENAPGIDTSIIVDCPECQNEIRTELPITEAFFRPSRQTQS